MKPIKRQFYAKHNAGQSRKHYFLYNGNAITCLILMFQFNLEIAAHSHIITHKANNTRTMHKTVNEVTQNRSK